MRLDHPVFKGPLDPGLQLAKKATPAHYREYPEGRTLPDEIEVWKVHEGEFPATVDVGLVSSPTGFTDSPDAEILSGGVNSKGPDSVAIGRHGNFFLWGFAGDPRQMTESARRVFVNLVVYARSFDGATPLVEKWAPSRDAMPGYVEHLRKHGSNRNVSDWLKKTFPSDVPFEPEALDRYYRENLEFLRHDDGRIVADADLRDLRVSNRKPEFFEAVLALLKADRGDARARRLLERYVKVPRLQDPDSLEAWRDENRPYLFFSDIGGYAWFVDVHAKRAAKASGPPGGSGR